MDCWMFPTGWLDFASDRGLRGEIRFREAVPRRSDRRELRRLLRRAARTYGSGFRPGRMLKARKSQETRG